MKIAVSGKSLGCALPLTWNTSINWKTLLESELNPCIFVCMLRDWRYQKQNRNEKEEEEEEEEGTEQQNY